MKIHPAKSTAGFTLVEMMIASFVAVVLFAGVGTLLLGTENLATDAYCEAELSIKTRELRERILFQAAPYDDGKISSGLLSGTIGEANSLRLGTKALVFAPAINVAAGGTGARGVSTVSQRIEFVRDSVDGAEAGYLVNDGQFGAARENWFRLTGVGWIGTRKLEVGYLPDDWLSGELITDNPKTTRNLYFLNISNQLGRITYRTRIAVPVFGANQVRNTASVFHDSGTP